MNFKVLSVAALVILSFCFSTVSAAEKTVETPKQQEERIESELNELFLTSMKTAAYRLDKTREVKPFGVIKKTDGTLGVFAAADSDEALNKMSVSEQSASVRRVLIELAAKKQITSSVMVMYSVVRQKGKDTQQGLMFEIEHADGISLMRFLPLTEKENSLDKESKRMVLELKALTTTVKPATVFARSIVQ